MIQNKYRKQFEKYDRKFEHATKYVFQEWGITIGVVLNLTVKIMLEA